MRVKIASGKVYEVESLERLVHQLHETSPYRSDSFRAYLDGFVTRLRPLKVWVEPTAEAKRTDEGYARWLGQEMLRVKRWTETTEPTEEEKAEKARLAAEEKARAAAAAKAAGAAAPAAAKPAAAAGEKPAAAPAAAKPATTPAPAAPAKPPAAPQGEEKASE
jgi:hypothetical protein